MALAAQTSCHKERLLFAFEILFESIIHNTGCWS